MLEFTNVRFMKRKAYYEVFIFYSKRPDELNIATGIKVAFNHINENKKGKSISGKHPNFEEDTKRVREIKERVDTIINHFYDTYNEKPPVKYVDEQYSKPFKIEKKKLDNILEYFPAFLNFKKGFVSSENNLQPYNSLKMAFEQFQNVKNIRLTFSNLDYDFYYDFLNFLSTERFDQRRKNIKKENKGLNNNTIKKRMSYLIAFLKYSIVEHEINLNIEKQKILIQRALSALEIKSYEVNNNNLSLNIHEVMELHLWDKCKPNLAKYKDFIVLQLLTGMRISDTKLVDEFDTEINEGYLIKHSEKTNDEFKVKLSSIAKDILKKYKYRINVIDHKYNQALKLIFKDFFEYYKKIYEAILCKDYKMTKIIVERKGKKTSKKAVPKFELASSKIGRVSYVSEKTGNKELSLKEIMQATGHRKIQTVQKYMDMSESISPVDLNKLLKARNLDIRNS